MTFDQTTLGNALGYGVRASLFAAAPAYLFVRGVSFADRGVQAIAVVYGPPLVILGAGAAEAVVRTVAQLFMAFVASKDREMHLESASAEFQAAHRLLRGAVMPIDGYSLIAMEVHRYIHYNKGDRSLIQDYYVYHTPFLVTKHSYTYIVKPVGKTVWKVVIVFKDATYRFVLKPAGRFTVRTLEIGFNVLDAVGFWTALQTVASIGASLIGAGVGLAMNMLGNRR